MKEKSPLDALSKKRDLRSLTRQNYNIHPKSPNWADRRINNPTIEYYKRCCFSKLVLPASAPLRPRGRLRGSTQGQKGSQKARERASAKLAHHEARSWASPSAMPSFRFQRGPIHLSLWKFIGRIVVKGIRPLWGLDNMTVFLYTVQYIL